MELVQDLLLTASFALILSFLVAKLVAAAVASREPESELGESESAGGGGGVVIEEVSFEERCMKSEGAFEGRRRVEFAGEVKEVDQFEGEPVPVHGLDEVEEALKHHRKRPELTERAPESEAKGPGEESAAVGLTDKSSGREEKASVEKASDADCQNSENRGVEEIGAKSETYDVVSGQSEQVRTLACDEIKGKGEAKISENRGVEEIGAKSETDDVVSAQSEQVRAAAWDEIKGKGEASEVKLDNCSDEDDWEGIERSELDDDYTAALKFEGR